MWTSVILGLFSGSEHPRGSGPSGLPEELRATYQRNHAEALLQLALFPSGREAIKQEPSVMKALEEVLEHGMTPEARQIAERALMALSDRQMHATINGEGPKHIMLSYQVRTTSCQAVILAKDLSCRSGTPRR